MPPSRIGTVIFAASNRQSLTQKDLQCVNGEKKREKKKTAGHVSSEYSQLDVSRRRSSQDALQIRLLSEEGSRFHFAPFLQVNAQPVSRPAGKRPLAERLACVLPNAGTTSRWQRPRMQLGIKGLDISTTSGPLAGRFARALCQAIHALSTAEVPCKIQAGLELKIRAHQAA